MLASSDPVPVNSDAILHPFLYAGDEAEAERRLADLLAGIQPFVRELAHSRLHSTSLDGRHSSDIEDIFSEVQLQLLGRLRELRQRRELQAIGNFRAYVATVVSNSCTQRL